MGLLGQFQIFDLFSEFCRDLGIFPEFGLTLGIRFEPVLGGLSRLKEMAPYTSMPSMSANENNILYSNSMKYNRNHLIRRLLSGITNDELEKLIQIWEEAKRPIPAPRIKKQRPVPIPGTKSTVKRMVDYFKQNPIPLAPQANLTAVRREMKSYARAFKINIVNDRDPLAQLQETKQQIGRFLKRLKVEMGGFKYSEALEVDPIMELQHLLEGLL